MVSGKNTDSVYQLIKTRQKGDDFKSSTNKLNTFLKSLKKSPPLVWWIFTWTTDWTRNAMQRLSPWRNEVDSTSWGSLGTLQQNLQQDVVNPLQVCGEGDNFSLQPSFGAVSESETEQTVKKADSVLQTAQNLWKLIVERRMFQKLLKIMDNVAYRLHNILAKQQRVFSWGLQQLHNSLWPERNSFEIK